MPRARSKLFSVRLGYLGSAASTPPTQLPRKREGQDAQIASMDSQDPEPSRWKRTKP